VRLGSIPSWLTEFRAQVPFYVSPYTDEHGEPNLKVWRLSSGEFLRFSFSRGIEFVIDREGTKIWADWPEDVSLPDAACYLRGPILGNLLCLRGVTCLHSSAIIVDGRAIAIAGMAGAGKSTTAAAFSRCGFPVLSDDICALDERDGEFWVQPGYPHLCLWPSSVQMLCGDEDALPPIAPPWTKRYMDLRPYAGFHSGPVRLGAVYLLTERSAGEDAPYCSESRPLFDLIRLVENTFVRNLLTPEMKARDFALLARLLARTPVRTVVPHSDPARLPQLCDAILNDFRGLPPWKTPSPASSPSSISIR